MALAEGEDKEIVSRRSEWPLGSRSYPDTWIEPRWRLSKKEEEAVKKNKFQAGSEEAATGVKMMRSK